MWHDRKMQSIEHWTLHRGKAKSLNLRVVDGVRDDLLEWGALSQISEDERQLSNWRSCFGDGRIQKQHFRQLKKKTLLG